MNREVLLFCCIALISSNICGQMPNYNAADQRLNAYRSSFWYEGNFMGVLSKYHDTINNGATKWQYQVDWQYRRQSDANYIKNGEHYNIIKDPYQSVFRPWIHYWVVPKKVRISLSPLGHWTTYTAKAEGPQTYNNEYRICPQITFFQNIGKLEIQQRYRYEFRFISNNYNVTVPLNNAFMFGDNFPGYGHKMRLRYMVRFNYPLNKIPTSKKGSWYISGWDELFIGLGNYTVDTKLIDQNRIIFLLGHYLKTNYPIKIEVGYTNVYAPKYSFSTAPTQKVDGTNTYAYNKLNWEMNSAFQVYLIFEEFHKIFQKKKERPKDLLK